MLLIFGCMGCMQDVLLAVRILTALGRIHVVTFHDLQPAVLLQNSLPQDTDVSLHSIAVTQDVLTLKLCPYEMVPAMCLSP